MKQRICRIAVIILFVAYQWVLLFEVIRSRQIAQAANVKAATYFKVAIDATKENKKLIQKTNQQTAVKLSLLHPLSAGDTPADFTGFEIMPVLPPPPNNAANEPRSFSK